MIFNNNSSQKILATTLALVLVAGLGTPVFAGGGGPPATGPGDMYGGATRGSITPGLILLIDQNTGSQTPIGDPTGSDGIGGLAFDTNDRLFAATITGGGQSASPSDLIEINPVDGSLIQNIGVITDTAGTTLKINDLANHPGTNVMYAVTASSAGNTGGLLYTIDTTNAVATLVGNTGLGTDETPIAFSPDGTLYMTCFNCQGGNIPAPDIGVPNLLTIDFNNNANIMTNVQLTGNFFVLVGLAFHPNNGFLYASEGFQVPNIHRISTAGTVVFIGSDPENIHDLTFFPNDMQAIGGELLPIDNTVLLLAGIHSSAIWMLPVLAGAAGIGAFYIKTRMNKE